MSRKIVAWGVASSSNEIWSVHESKATAEGVVSLNYNNHLVPLVRRDPKEEAVLTTAQTITTAPTITNAPAAATRSAPGTPIRLSTVGPSDERVLEHGRRSCRHEQ